MERSASARAAARLASVTRPSAARRASRANLVGPRQVSQPRLQGVMRLLGPAGPRGHVFQITLQLHQTVQLPQAQRRG